MLRYGASAFLPRFSRKIRTRGFGGPYFPASPPPGSSPDPPPTVGTNWSTLGIVADGTTDNTDALNALPTSTQIIGNTVGIVRFNNKWLWKSGLQVSCVAGCRLLPMGGYASPSAHIEQLDLTTPISDVLMFGLDIFQDAWRGNKVRIFRNYINNWTMQNWSADLFDGLAVIRGNNHNIGYFAATNGHPDVGNEGWRPVGGNIQLIHHGQIYCGDGACQVSPVADPESINFDLPCSNITYEDMLAYSYGAEAILVGIGNQPTDTDPLTCSLNDLAFRRITGAGLGKCIQALTGNTTGEIADVELTDIDVDASADTDQNASMVLGVNALYAATGGTLKRLTGTRVTIRNSYQRAVSVIGAHEDVVLDDGVFYGPRSGSLATVSIQGGLRPVVKNSDIYSGGGSALVIGVPVGAIPYTATSFDVDNNTIREVPTGKNAISVENCAGGTITDNVTTARAAATSTVGVRLKPADGNGPGSNNVSVTGNNVSGMTAATKIVDAPGQGNSGSGNTGASNFP